MSFCWLHAVPPHRQKIFPFWCEFLITKLSAVMNVAHVSEPANQLGNQRNRGLIMAVDWLRLSVIISWRAVWICLNYSRLNQTPTGSKVIRHLLKTDYLRKSNLTFPLVASLSTLNLSPPISHCTSLTLAIHSWQLTLLSPHDLSVHLQGRGTTLSCTPPSLLTCIYHTHIHINQKNTSLN